MNPIDGFFLIQPEDHTWQIAKPMKIPFADLLERTKSEILGARIWRFPPKSANTLHRHVKAEEFYFVLEGVGRMRVGDETLTVPKYGGVLVGPQLMRQVFNDTDTDVLWLMIGAPDKEFGPDEVFDIKRFWPTDPTQLPAELAGVEWPPKEGSA
jgi:mannose-6-phosphate isomerase-like protein (cupin superfamily)